MNVHCCWLNLPYVVLADLRKTELASCHVANVCHMTKTLYHVALGSLKATSAQLSSHSIKLINIVVCACTLYIYLVLSIARGTHGRGPTHMYVSIHVIIYFQWSGAVPLRHALGKPLGHCPCHLKGNGCFDSDIRVTNTKPVSPSICNCSIDSFAIDDLLN